MAAPQEKRHYEDGMSDVAVIFVALAALLIFASIFGHGAYAAADKSTERTLSSMIIGTTFTNVTFINDTHDGNCKAATRVYSGWFLDIQSVVIDGNTAKRQKELEVYSRGGVKKVVTDEVVFAFGTQKVLVNLGDCMAEMDMDAVKRIDYGQPNATWAKQITLAPVQTASQIPYYQLGYVLSEKKGGATVTWFSTAEAWKDDRIAPSWMDLNRNTTSREYVYYTYYAPPVYRYQTLGWNFTGVSCTQYDASYNMPRYLSAGRVYSDCPEG